MKQTLKEIPFEVRECAYYPDNNLHPVLSACLDWRKI